jgi:hypothetical protein
MMAVPKMVSANDTSHLTDAQQQALADSFMEKFNEKVTRVFIHPTFQVVVFQTNVSVKINSGWRTRPFYKGDDLRFIGLRCTKRSGIVFQFMIGEHQVPSWAEKEVFELAEMSYDKAAEAFGAAFTNWVSDTLGSPWHEAVRTASGWTLVSVDEYQHLPPSEPPAKKPIEELTDWGSW